LNVLLVLKKSYLKNNILELIFGYQNVYLDSASEYDLFSVHERLYIEQLLLKLGEILNKDFQEFEFYFLFAHSSSVVPDSVSIKKANKILFWFGDESGSFPGHLSDFYTVIFKSYIIKEDLNIFLNPVGYVNEFAALKTRKSKKDIRVFFSVNLNLNRIELYRILFFRNFKFLRFLKVIPRRTSRKIFRRLRKRLKTNLSAGNSVFLFSHQWKSGLDYNKYHNYLLRSTFSLCPKGFYSSETFRHLESLHAGCIVISEKMPEVSIYQNHPFLVYNNLQELEQILDKIEKKEFDEDELLKCHQIFYQKSFTLFSITSRIAQICLANKNISENVVS